MYRMYLSILLVLELFAVPARAQQSALPIRDASGITLIGKAINASGGITALDAVQDYTATGTFAFQLDQLLTGNVTLTGRGTDFRLDAQLQNGSESWYILDGQGTKKDADGTISALSYQQVASIESFNSPIMQIASAVTNSSMNVSYLGTAVRLGHQVVGVRVRTLSLPYFATDVRTQLVDKNFYFDATTFLLVTVEDLVFPAGQIDNGLPHQIQFSNYQKIQGIMVPFSIADSIGNQGFTAITLNQVTFNSGYSNTQFQP